MRDMLRSRMVMMTTLSCTHFLQTTNLYKPLPEFVSFGLDVTDRLPNPDPATSRRARQARVACNMLGASHLDRADLRGARLFARSATNRFIACLRKRLLAF